MFSNEIKARFWKYVWQTPAGCWEWSAEITKTGYGRYVIDKVGYKVHRLAWMFATGEDPGELYVLHRCHNRRCVNIEHLYLGNHNQNMRDMVKSGRVSKGETHRFAKITEQTAREIYESEGSYNQLADRFGVSYSLVYRIKNKRTWNHLHRSQPPE